MSEAKRSTDGDQKNQKPQETVNLRGSGKNLARTEIITPKPKSRANNEKNEELDPELETILDKVEEKTTVILNEVFKAQERKELEQAETVPADSPQEGVTNVGLSENQAKVLDKIVGKNQLNDDHSNLKIEEQEKEIMEYQRHRIEYVTKEKDALFSEFRENLKNLLISYRKFSKEKEKTDQNFDSNFDKLMFFLVKILENSKEFHGVNPQIMFSEKAFEAYQNFSPENMREQKFLMDAFREISHDQDLLTMLYEISDRLQDLKHLKHIFKELNDLIEMTKQGMIGSSDLHKKYFEHFNTNSSLKIENLDEVIPGEEKAA